MPGGYHNQVRVTITSSGSGPFALGPAVQPFNTFAQSGVTDQEIIPYSATDSVTNNAEKGWGLYSATGSSIGGPSLTRNPYIVTGGGTAPFAASSSGTQVYIDPAVSDLIQLSLMAQANLGGL